VDSCFQSGVDAASTAQLLTALQPTVSLDGHTNSIRTCSFHPSVAGLMCSAAQDSTFRMFDVEQGHEVSRIDIPQAVTVNMSFNYDGSLLALAGKDRNVRIIDPRARSVVLNTRDTLPSLASSAAAGSRSSVDLSATNAYLGRNLRVAWCCTRTGVNADPLVTVSAASNGQRQIHLWDPRSMSAPLITKHIDNASGQLFPLFDETMNTLFVAGKGDTVIRTFELLFLEETTSSTSSSSSASTADKVLPSFMEKLPDFQSSADPIAGVCMLPKRCCAVREVEVCRLLKLTTDALTPISYKVPRADHLKAFFHDDLYAPCRARRSLAAVADWESADTDPSVFQPLLESLQPEGMQAISSSVRQPTPSVQRSKIDSFKQQIQKQEEESKQRESTFARLQNLAVQNAQYNKNLSGGASSPVPTSASAATSSKQGAVAVEEEVDSDDNWDDDN
jgi:hypothetical protein